MDTGKRYYSLLAAAALGLGVAPAAEPQPAGAAKVQTEHEALETLRRTRDALIEVGDFAAALQPAEQVVGALDGRSGFDVAEDLLRLGLVQAGLEDYDAAEISYLNAIERLQRAQGVFSAALIPAYHGLGRAYIDARRYADAVTALEHARTLGHRNFGLFDPAQVPVLDDLTRAHLESGNDAAARALEEQRLKKAIRHFGADAPELVPFYRHLGDFYYRHLARLYGNLPSSFRAHDQYWKALEIASARSGDASPESLDLLRRLTAVEMHFDDRPRGRERLLAALESHAEIDPRERGLSLAALGDFAAVEGDSAAAERYYAAAYEALREADGVAADELFAAPQMLDFVPPDDGVDGSAPFPAWRWGTIELAFDVSAAGRASDVRTVAAQPGVDALASAYRKRIAAARFRPKLEHGRPVAATDVRYTARFRYYLPD